jgi:hypothetical protein
MGCPRDNLIVALSQSRVDEDEFVRDLVGGFFDDLDDCTNDNLRQPANNTSSSSDFIVPKTRIRKICASYRGLSLEILADGR